MVDHLHGHEFIPMVYTIIHCTALHTLTLNSMFCKLGSVSLIKLKFYDGCPQPLKRTFDWYLPYRCTAIPALILALILEQVPLTLIPFENMRAKISQLLALNFCCWQISWRRTAPSGTPFSPTKRTGAVFSPCCGHPFHWRNTSGRYSTYVHI